MEYDTYIISLDNFLGIFFFTEALLLFNLLSSLTVSSREMKLKLKVTKFFFIRSAITFILGWAFVFFKSHFHFTQVIFCKSCTIC